MAFITKMLFPKKEELACPTSGDPADKIKLISFAPIGEALVSGTPFCGKIEVALRLAGLEYEGYKGDVTNARVAPKKKFPVLRHGSRVVPDSSAIFDYLVSTYPTEMAALIPTDPKEKAIADAVQRMLEEHAYFAIMTMLWLKPEVWAEYGPKIFADVPSVMRGAVMSFVKSSVARDMYGQGMGRHSEEEVKVRLAKDLDACVTLLEDSGAYLSGQTPSQADCFLFNIIHSAQLTAKLGHPPAYSAMVADRPVLLAFHDRIKEKCFPEGTNTCWKGEWDPKAQANEDPKA